MTRVRLEDADGWELSDHDQDIRGKEVWDASGHKLGVVETMVVNTELQKVDAVVLDTGTEYAARDLTLTDEVVYVMEPGAVVEAEHRVGHGGIRRRAAAVPPDPAVPQAPPAPPPQRVDPEPSRDRQEAQTSRAVAHRAYADFDDDFHQHYASSYNDDDRQYADFEPAYRFGYDMAYDERFVDQDYDAAEADLRQVYYRRHGYPMSDQHVWHDIGDAVRHAYNSVRRAL